MCLGFRMVSTISLPFASTSNLMVSGTFGFDPLGGL